jgi:thiol-disulfide isomerase/thioredoxin
VAASLAACGNEREASSSGEGTPYSPIRPAPDFELETLDGDTLRTADLADRTAILMNFWASWCFPCKAEMPELVAIHEEYDDKGLAVLGVTVNDLPRDSRAFVAEIGVPFPSVIGTPAMLEAYGISPWLPTTILVTDGQIVREWVGPQTRKQLEYSIQVALGLATPIDPPTAEAADGRR